jgi:hypothetical protein
MALATGESMDRGFIRQDGVLALTTNTSGATMQRGYLRDPDGRLVVRVV